MKNFTKAFLISLLMSGSFMVNAAEYTDEEMAAMANHCEMSVSDLRELEKSMPLEEFYKPVAYLFDRNSSQLADELNRLMITTGQDEPIAFQNQPFTYTPQHAPHMTEMPHTAGYSDEQMAAMATHWAMSMQDLRALEKNMPLDDFYKPVAHQFPLQHQEVTSNDHQFALDLDRKERENRNRRAKERANADYLRSLQEREEQAAAAPWIPAPIKERIYAQTWEYLRENHPALEKYRDICVHLNGIPQNADVHVLDGYVFGPTNAIHTLLEVGRLYGAEKPVLTLAQVGAQMVSFIKDNKEFFDDYKYEDSALNSGQIIGHVNTHFANMDNEIGAYSPEAREVWSRAWTLAWNLSQKDDDMTGMRIIFDEVVEGPLTKGGCIQGRIDRGFVGYARLLGTAGVTLPNLPPLHNPKLAG